MNLSESAGQKHCYFNVLLSICVDLSQSSLCVLHLIFSAYCLMHGAGAIPS